MHARLDLRLLGGFHADIDGDTVPPDAWRQGRAAALVKLLAPESADGTYWEFVPGLWVCHHQSE